MCHANCSAAQILIEILFITFCTCQIFKILYGAKMQHQLLFSLCFHTSFFFAVSAGLQKRISGLFNNTIHGDLKRILQHTQRLRPTVTRHERNVGGIWKRNITPVIAGKLCAIVLLVRVMESIFRPLGVACT